MSAALEKLLEGLNAPQREAVTHDHGAQGPLLVLAGPGSGKTAVLTRRLAYLCLQGVPPGQLFAATFTQKAAEELSFRVGRSTAGEIQISTFHALGYKLLLDRVEGRSNLQRLGFAESRITILNDEEKKQFLTAVQKTAPENEWMARFERFRHAGESGLASEEEASLKWSVENYALVKRAQGRLDFTDLLALSLKLLDENPGLLGHYRQKFRYLHVDEFQDMSPLQYALLRRLAGTSPNVFAVGDDDQSIYRFQGADPRNVEYFTRDFSGHRTLKLEINYRSTPAILSLANAVFLEKPAPLRKHLKAGKPGADSSKITVRHFKNEAEERTFVRAEIERSAAVGIPHSQMAVLFRLNAEREGWRTALPPGVQLLTLHASKGLEFSVVFYSGLEEGLSPYRTRSKVSKREENELLMEEKRLFYVGITRAKEKLYLLSCKERIFFRKKVRSRPSRFLSLVPKSLAERPPLWARIRRILVEAPESGASG